MEKWERSILVAVSIGAVVFSAPVAAQPLARKLTFNSVQPCRIVDTRIATGGILLGGTARNFDVVGETTNYGGQGGSAGGCGIPGFAGGLARVQAVAINIVAVDPSGEGFLSAWPADQPLPLASTVNFQKLTPNLNVANGVIVPVRQDAQGGDLRIAAGVANAHVVVDITGYFSKAEPRKYYLTADTFTGGNALTACAAGYHMASLWEIFDPTVLSYNKALGLDEGANSDAGSGPPYFQGWIRTGTTATSVDNQPGLSNCVGWTSNLATDDGSAIGLSFSWTAAPTAVSPWAPVARFCSLSTPVWCVED